jgi:hypothetical protein
VQHELQRCALLCAGLLGQGGSGSRLRGGPDMSRLGRLLRAPLLKQWVWKRRVWRIVRDLRRGIEVLDQPMCGLHGPSVRHDQNLSYNAVRQTVWEVQTGSCLRP